MWVAPSTPYDKRPVSFLAFFCLARAALTNAMPIFTGYKRPRAVYMPTLL